MNKLLITISFLLIFVLKVDGQIISFLTVENNFNYYESDYSEHLEKIIGLLEDHDRKIQELIIGLPEAARIFNEHQNITTAHSLLSSYSTFTREHRPQIERQISKLDEAFDFLSRNDVVNFKPYSVEKLLRSSYVQELYRKATGTGRRARRKILKDSYLPYLVTANVELGLLVENQRNIASNYLKNPERSRHEVCLGGGHGGWHEYYIMYVSSDSILVEDNILVNQRKEILLERKQILDNIFDLVSSREILQEDDLTYGDRFLNLRYSITKVGKNRGCRYAHCYINQYEERFRKPIFQVTEDQYFDLTKDLYSLALLQYHVQERISFIQEY